MSKLPNTKVTAKVEVIKTSKELKTIEIQATKKLHQITAHKEDIKLSKSQVTKAVKETITLINAQVKLLKTEHPIYAKLPKKKLIALVKGRLDSTEQVINVTCNMMMLGLSIDNTLSLSTMAYLVKSVNNKTMSKSAINRGDKDALAKLIKDNKAKEAVIKAKKLIAKK